MPQETRRTKSMNYTVMNLLGLMELAELARPLGVDIWNAKTEDGRSIRTALDYLVGHLDGAKPWPHQQISPFDSSKLIPVLYLAARAWEKPSYRDLLERLVPANQVRAHRDPTPFSRSLTVL